MQLDMDLVRKILLNVEENKDNLHELKIEGYTRDEIIYHCDVLDDEGMFLDKSYRKEYADGGVYYFYVTNLSWKGHKFLNEIRDDSKFGKAKDFIKKNALPLTIDTIKTIIQNKLL